MEDYRRWRINNLTKGKISTLILGFAIPVFLGNLLQLTYSLADTRIVGSFLGERSLAAVGATTTISNLIVGFLLGLANGFHFQKRRESQARTADEHW